VIKELVRIKPKKLSLHLILVLTISSLSTISSIETSRADACVPTSSTTNGLTTDTITATGTCTYTIPDGVSFMDVLLVGGGGSGGSYGGGGGGGGGVLFQTSYSVTAGSQINLTIGAGGTAPSNGSASGANGGDTSFDSLTASGGGGGGAGGSGAASNGLSGASGGGGGVSTNASVGSGGSNTFNVLNDSTRYGNLGGAGVYSTGTYNVAGGGGGAGGGGQNGYYTQNTGNNSGVGGIGVTFFGAQYGCGGGGGANTSTSATIRGLHSGNAFGTNSSNALKAGCTNAGDGGSYNTNSGNATVNTGGGGGGGGGGTSYLNPGSGGSGIIILQYPAANSSCSVISAASGGFTYDTITSTSLCNLTVPAGVSQISVFAVGGGGGGGQDSGAGGGGGGGAYASNISVTPGQFIYVHLGAGGSAGSNPTWLTGTPISYDGLPGFSTTVILDTRTITASGGGGGGACRYISPYCGITSTAGLGANHGGYGGVGSGSGLTLTTTWGSANLTGVNHGQNGFCYAYDSSGNRYGSGLPGGNPGCQNPPIAAGSGFFDPFFSLTYGAGGTGSGGADASANTGKGGNGGDSNSRLGGNGGSGIVVLKFTTPDASRQGLNWTINGAFVGYSASCTAGKYTQTVWAGPLGNFAIAKFTAPNQTTSNASCSFTVPNNVDTITYLVVGGGGGGGYDGGGGGGGGTVLTATVSVNHGETFTVTVGHAGIGGTSYVSGAHCTDGGGLGNVGANGTSGETSTITSTQRTINAFGGGGGGGRCRAAPAVQGNTGGNGHLSNQYWNSDSPDNRSSASPDGTNSTGTGNRGGRASVISSGGGGASGGNGGNATTTNFSSSFGGAADHEFAGTPLEGYYGGGGAGATYCHRTQPPGDTNTTSDSGACASFNGVGGDFIRPSGGGSGGNGGDGSGSATANTTADNGGGGAGGGGYSTISGANGSAGVVIIEYAISVASNENTVQVTRYAQAVTGSLTDTTTVGIAYATLDDVAGSCGTFSAVTGRTSIPNDYQNSTSISIGSSSSPTSTSLARGFCYQFTQDSSTVTGLTAPSDGGGAMTNLTSPVIIIPKRAIIRWPKTIPLDPRATSFLLPNPGPITGAANAQFCFYENNGTTKSTSLGTPIDTQTIQFTNTNTLAHGIDLTTQTRTAPYSFWDSATNATIDISKLKVSLKTGLRITSNKNILVRWVPYVPHFTSDCKGGTTIGNLNVTSGEVAVINTKRITLTLTNTIGKNGELKLKHG
jgi:hypothetical protein